MEHLITGRVWSELGSRDIDGKAERPRERERASQYFPELGIYDYRHRYYHPALGRFLQTDPTGFDAGDMNLFRYCGDDPVDRSDPMGLVDTNASFSNHFLWLQGGSELSSHEDDLLRQGQVRFADPTGNYKEPLEKHVARNGETHGEPGLTKYTVSDIREINGTLVIQPTLNWWVLLGYLHTKTGVGELEHVSRWLYWQYKGDGAAAARSFNGTGNLAGKIENARAEEKNWQNQNIHMNGRHDVSRNLELKEQMNPADSRKAIDNIGPAEEPYLTNPYSLKWP